MKQKEYPHVPMQEIVDRVKDVVSPNVDGKVYDKHAAEALKMKTTVLRVYKCVNYLPIDHVVMFCVENEISIDWMLFGSSAEAKEMKWKSL